MYGVKELSNDFSKVLAETGIPCDVAPLRNYYYCCCFFYTSFFFFFISFSSFFFQTLFLLIQEREREKRTRLCFFLVSDWVS